jgi:hypothetical protein
MNGGGDDDLFLNNNNRQRQLTIATNIRQLRRQQQQSQNDFNADNARNRTIGNKRSSTSRRSCAFGDSTSMSELQKQVLDESQLGSTFARSVRTKTVSVRSMSKALSGARLAGRAQGLAHRGRFGSVLQVVRFVCVAVLLMLQLLCVGDRCSRTHILSNHINNQPFKITIKKEESDDDDDG